MPKKQKANSNSDLWITPRYSLKGPAGERAWENRPGGVPSTNRYFELADIALGFALGVKKPEKKKKAAALPTHDTSKSEPYSQ